jgi:hypothetical protein
MDYETYSANYRISPPIKEIHYDDLSPGVGDGTNRVRIVFQSNWNPTWLGGNINTTIPRCFANLSCPTTIPLAGDNTWSPSSSAIKPNWNIDNVELVASVVQTDPGYIDDLMDEVNSGSLQIQYNTWRDYPINLIANNTYNEMYLPCVETRAWGMMSFPERIVNTNMAKVRGTYDYTSAGLKEYLWIIGGIQVPQLPVPLTRLSNSLSAPLQQIELEKGLEQCNIPVRNLMATWRKWGIARGFGRYGSSFNLKETDLRLRLQYTSQPNSLVLHNWVYHRRTFVVGQNQRFVEV